MSVLAQVDIGSQPPSDAKFILLDYRVSCIKSKTVRLFNMRAGTSAKLLPCFCGDTAYEHRSAAGLLGPQSAFPMPPFTPRSGSV